MKWQMVQLQKIASEEKGSIVSGPFGSNISAKYFVDEGIPVIRGNNLTKGVQKFIDDGFVYLTETKAAEFRNCIAIKDDIVFTAAGSIGQVGIIPDNTKFEKYVISNKQLRVRIDKKKADPMFVYYWLSCPRMTGYLEGMNNGGAVPLLNLGIIRRVPVPLPPLDTQYRISAVVSNFNDSIDNNRRRIQLLEESARLLFREWFVYFRFPGHGKVHPIRKSNSNGVKIVDDVPEGWEKLQVKDIIRTVNSRKKIQKSEYDEAGLYPCVDQSQEYISGYTDRKDYVINNTIPIVIFGDHTRIIKYVDFPFVSGADGTQLLVSKHNRINSEFLYFILKNINLSNYFYARHFKFLKDQWILVPSENLCSSFNLFSKDIMNQIGIFRIQNQKLAQARDLLLPRLMSGVIEV